MTRKNLKNTAASVKQRLLNLSRHSGEDFQLLLTRYAVERLLSRGVRMGALGPRTIRAVTHLDVSAQGIERSLEAAQEVFTG